MNQNQRPARALPELAVQLRAALEAISDEPGATESQDYRRFLRAAVARAWRATAIGEFHQIREVVDAIREARPYIDDAEPKLNARSRAAVELQAALALLYVAEDELREVELEHRLADRGRSPFERAILVTLQTAERPLRQNEVRQRLPEEERKTSQRVGQVLRELHQQGYCVRQYATARGRAEVGHFALSPKGWRLCRDLGLVPEPEPRPKEVLEPAADRVTRLQVVGDLARFGKKVQSALLDNKRYTRVFHGFCSSGGDEETAKLLLGFTSLDRLSATVPSGDPETKSDYQQSVEKLGWTHQVMREDGVTVLSAGG